MLVAQKEQGAVWAECAVLKGQTVKGTPGTTLMKFAEILRTEDAEQMMQAIEQDCINVIVNE